VDFFQKKFGLVASISRGLRAVIDIIWISSSLEIAKTVSGEAFSSSSNGNSLKENKI
jgi:hypothetical protein